MLTLISFILLSQAREIYQKPGVYALDLLQKRFGAKCSAPDLYNTLGGEAHGVDFFFRKQIDASAPVPGHKRKLFVPSFVDDKASTIYVGQSEVARIADCLDRLPWSPIAWSVHRGMRDILISYAKPYMEAYRVAIAKALSDAVKTHTYALRHQG